MPCVVFRVTPCQANPQFSCSVRRQDWQACGAQRPRDAQTVDLGVNALRLTLREQDDAAGLALIASLRKRLLNLPPELAADETWRVRLPRVTPVALNILCDAREDFTA